MPDLRNCIGIPYLRNGRDPSVGLDCWRFVMYVGRLCFMKSIPDFLVDAEDVRSVFRTYLLERESLCWEAISKPEEACIVAMALDPYHPTTIQHFGIGVDRRRFAHALRKTGSIISRYEDVLWKNRIKGLYRWNG